MKQKYMLPFIGENYQQGINGNKILILGESSHDPNSESDDFDRINHTIALAADAIGYDYGEKYWNKSRFYTRICRMFGHEARDIKQRRDFWHSVAYYNFLQVVFTKPRVYPSPGQWEEGERPFLALIDQIKPDVVICYSKRMWNYLPKHNEAQEDNSKGIPFRKATILNSNGFQPKLIGFNHPTARGFSWPMARSYVAGIK